MNQDDKIMTEFNNMLTFYTENEYNQIKYNETKNAAILNSKNGVPYISFPSLTNIDFIDHGFSTKLGGVSTEHLSSMNLSFHRGDKRENVLENYSRICNSIGVSKENLVFSDQIHDTKIHKVTIEDRGKGINQISDIVGIDGLITNVPLTPLVTFYADCVPLYFVDIKNKAIGLSHSGWRGTVNKIGLKTIMAMTKEYGTNPEDVTCVIGPSICASCYEVSEDVASEFSKEFSQEIIPNILFKKENGKYQLDLWLANQSIMLEAGLLPKNITISTICTCCNDKIFYSHRASKGMRGNLAAILSIKG